MTSRILIFTLFVLLFIPLHASGQILINEFQASNQTTISDEDGDYEDWIELYNAGSSAVNLNGYGLSDDPSRPYRWIMPPFTMQPGEFRIIWASGKDRRIPAGELHTNFSISSAGEPLLLHNPDGEQVDFISAVEVPTDISFGRYPDGADAFFFFDEPTPGEANPPGGYQGLLSAPEFSHAPGFYAQSFGLEISHPDESVTIRYSTDGLIPDEESPVYEEAITLKNRTQDEPLISLIPTSGNWVPPLGDVPKAMAVTARAFREGYMPGEPVTGTFFINDDGSFSHDLPVLALTTPAKNFFDDDIGIYVFGNAEGGNFMQRGIEWERPAWFEWFGESGNPEYAGGLGLRIHGGTSRRAPQKTLRMYFRNSYGDRWFNFPVFEDFHINSFRRLLLRHSGQDERYTMMRDAVMHAMLEGTNMDFQAYRPAVVYLNGEYWGLHNIRERQDKHYIGSHHDVDPENLDLLSYRSLEINEGDREHYLNMLDFLEQNSLEDDANLAWLDTQMDIDNYTDFKVAEIFLYRWDIGNLRHWRERTPEGRWRWMMFDLDTAYGGFWSVDEPWTFDALAYNTEPNGPWDGFQGHNHNTPNATFLLRKLLENEGYRAMFINRFADMMNTRFRPDYSIELIDQFSERIASEIPRQSDRWRQIDSFEDWEAEIQRLRDFAELRPEHQWQHIEEYFDLEGRIEITVQLGAPGTGEVGLNSLNIGHELPGVGSQPFPFTGIYAKNIPVSLEARPYPGFAFDFWEVNGEVVEEPVLELHPEDDITIKAWYTEDDEAGLFPVSFAVQDGSEYQFSSWPANSPAGTFPDNMVFVYMDEFDPGLDTEIEGEASGAYNLSSRTRINGLGEQGFAFINTGNEEGNPGFPGRKLGGAVLALDTRGAEQVFVGFEAGTVVPNSREYGWRLQYRIGNSGTWHNITGDDGNMVEYIRGEAGETSVIGPVQLPDYLTGKPYIQLMWRYFHTGIRHDTESGARTQLRLDDIRISTDAGIVNTEDEPEIVNRLQLHQNYPNPFNPETIIRFDLPQSGHVRLDVFDITGRLIATLADESLASGTHTLRFDASRLASGVYLYRLRTGGEVITRKMTVIK